MMGNFYRLEPARQRELSFRRLLKYLQEVVYPYHPAFRESCRKAGVDPTRIRTYEEFCELPLMTKGEYRAAPLSYILQPIFPGKKPLFPTTPIDKKYLLKYAAQAMLNKPRVKTALFRKDSLKERIRQRAMREWFPIHTHASSGSTGDPTPAVYTHRDLTHILPELSAAHLVQPDSPSAGVPTIEYDHRRMNIFPGAPHLAFFQSIFIKTTVGINLFDTFGGKVIPTDRQIEIFANGGFNTVGAIPSYLVYWLRRAIELVEAGRIKPFGTSFMAAVLGGESVSPHLKKHLHDLASRLGAHPSFRVLETFGSTEMKWAGFECDEGSGLHLNPKFYFWELLHPQTRKPVGPGEPGVLVFSHVDWRGTTFTRYWTGDLVQGGYREGTCPKCGYSFFRVVGPIARADKDFSKVKGVQVALQVLVGAVRDTPGVRNCQVILDKEDEFGRDLVIVRVLPELGADTAKIERMVCENIRAATELTPDKIVFETNPEAFEAELFARTGIKAEFLVERRTAS